MVEMGCGNGTRLARGMLLYPVPPNEFQLYGYESITFKERK